MLEENDRCLLSFLADSCVHVWYLYLTSEAVPFAPNCFIAITLNFYNLFPPSSGHSFSQFNLISYQTLSLRTLHVRTLLPPSLGEQNAGVLQMRCQRGEQGGLPPGWARWAPIALSWLIVVPTAAGVADPLPLCNSDSLEVTRAKIHSAAASFPLSHPSSTDSRVSCIFGEKRKNGAFWILKGTWQRDPEVQMWPHSNFPVNKWFWRGKNFHSFMYKPGGTGNPQCILVGTLKDCVKLHKDHSEFYQKFWLM